MFLIIRLSRFKTRLTAAQAWDASRALTLKCFSVSLRSMKMNRRHKVLVVVDESYLAAQRVRRKRGRGTYDKTTVFVIKQLFLACSNVVENFLPKFFLTALNHEILKLLRLTQFNFLSPEIKYLLKNKCDKTLFLENSKAINIVFQRFLAFQK